MKYVMVFYIFSILAFSAMSFHPLQQTPEGEKLFKQQCAASHHPVKALTGPPFQRIRNYYSEEQLLTFMHNPAKFISRDKKMQVVRGVYGSVTMTAYPFLKAGELKAILDYVDRFPYDSLSPLYAHRRYSSHQQDSVIKISTDYLRAVRTQFDGEEN